MKLHSRAIIKSLTLSFGLLLIFTVLSSHDLFLKMETYFLKPNQEATISLYNGTFEKSENIITRDRMLDASVMAQGERIGIKPEQWQDQDSTITQLPFNTGQAGTYVVGVSTKARNIELSAEKFNSYLEHDGILDMLEQRRNDSVLDQDALESYQKHVKAIYQVGDVKTNDWKTALGYPIEFVPLANPYEKFSGEKLEVQLLLDGKPLPKQLVYADYIQSTPSHSHSAQNQEHEHDGQTHAHEHADGDAPQHTHKSQGGEEHSHTGGQQLRTNAQGIVTLDLPHEGIYYIRTIYMTLATDSEELTHRSKWATLTFEVSHKHDSSTHTHEHEHEGGIPTWIFALGSLVVIGLLFLVFRKKN